MSSFFNNNEDGNRKREQVHTVPSEGVLTSTFMRTVFTYMSAAVLVSGLAAWFTASNGAMMELIFGTPLHWVVMLAPIGVILLMNGRFHKMSAGSMMTLYFVFATLMGISISYIFIVYQLGTIFQTFLIAGGTFAFMAFLGYTTKTDLTKLGSILYMALFGIFLVMIVNLFMQSSALHYAISFLGVFLFIGLTAYDVQKWKRVGLKADVGTQEGSKIAMIAAVDLYLDFLNLFIFLLSILGNRD